jgi:hypothetical protein
MADRQVQIPDGAFLNDAEEAALYQRMVPGHSYVNETQQAAGGGGTTTRRYTLSTLGVG